ncbi:hypothetical protein B0T09DRAFT_371457 [Sordaria sp. MPI-SDFR-AT-0083]|nr:hypothetical protein B0T09DRAFT_371457 [Sordaria sp. MPI-SDFR-AT-0083]
MAVTSHPAPFDRIPRRIRNRRSRRFLRRSRWLVQTGRLRHVRYSTRTLWIVRGLHCYRRRRALQALVCAYRWTHRDPSRRVFAECAVVDSRTSTVIPEGVSLLAAVPLGCAGRTAWRAVKEAGLRPGQWLGIVGSGGGLGHLVVQFATKMGLKVVGIEVKDEGLELTKEMGADVVIDARKGKDEVVREVGKAVLGDDGKDVDHNGLFATDGVDATDSLSDADDAAGLACAITKMHGLVVQVAQPLEVKIPFIELILRDVRIKGSLQCSGKESEELLKVFSDHEVKVKMTPFYGLDQVEELEKVVSSGKLQGRAAIIIDPHQLQHEKEMVRH